MKDEKIVCFLVIQVDELNKTMMSVEADRNPLFRTALPV